MQHEITKEIPLLDARGNLTEAGYAKKLMSVYDRKMVKGGFARLKEWDYYYVGNERFGIALTIADYSIVLSLSQLEGVEAVEIVSGSYSAGYRSRPALRAWDAELVDPLLAEPTDS